ncbi:MFS transporter [Pseudomassariella vexata]|uniref:MFS transporter n=1 Tax=Pseudomassariella vexata TaxID=1141098 RepID=A0A1Y2EBW6_9PEZI|nr:MFS transporter [Pseudomassariella vexata]ORY69060.1 MFS transporter [Pseudomassariella vexata]
MAKAATDISSGPDLDSSISISKDADIPPVSTTHVEDAPVKFDGPLSRDVDVAMALFDHPGQIHGPRDPVEERRLVRKIDFMILPYLAVCYAFFYIDKTTLSYAAIFGIREDLHLKGAEYNWLSSMFYFGFLFWAFPTNFLMQKFPIGKYLGINIFMWGFFLMLQAAAHSFASLMALRFLAGAAEACSDPSFMLITSMWYTRKQQPVRMGLWYMANGLGIALGGLLGYGIGNIRGFLPSWKYEFLIIGALCCIWGIVIVLFLPDSPVSAKALTKAEKRMAVQRLRENQTGIENKHLKAYQVREAFLDIKLYLFFVLGIVCNVPNGGISNFGTLIIKGFGFSTLVTTLMQVPYGVLIAICILVCVYLNDRCENKRCLFILIFLCPNIAGAFGLRYLDAGNQAGRLVSYYLTGPYNAAFVMILSLQVANTSGHTKKVVTNAVLFLGYCIGNIIGPFFYLSNQAPHYELGIWSIILSHLLEACIIVTFWIMMSRENRRRDKIQSVMVGGLEGRDLDATAFLDMTDRENLNFRYIY